MDNERNDEPEFDPDWIDEFQDEETKAELAPLLDGADDLLASLAFLTWRWSSGRDWDWPTSETRLVGRLARKLNDAIEALPSDQSAMLEHWFEGKSGDLFGPQAEVDPDYGMLPPDFFMYRFREQLKLIAVETQSANGVRGRPPEDLRAKFAAQAATLFLDHGLKPTKYETGAFANALRVILKRAGFQVPDRIYPVVATAVDAAERRRNDPVR